MCGCQLGWLAGCLLLHMSPATAMSPSQLLHVKDVFSPTIQQVPDPPKQPRRRRYCSANWCAGCSGCTVIVFLTCCDSLHFNILTDSGSTSLLHQPASHSFTHSFIRCNLIWINKGPDLLSIYVFLQGIRDTSSCCRSSLIPSPGDEKGAVCEQCAKIVSSKERRNVCTSLAIRNRKPRVGMDGWDSGVRTCTGEVRNTMGPSWLVGRRGPSVTTLTSRLWWLRCWNCGWPRTSGLWPMCASGSSYVAASWPLRGSPLGSRCPPRVGVLHGKKFCTFRFSLGRRKRTEKGGN